MDKLSLADWRVRQSFMNWRNLRHAVSPETRFSNDEETVLHETGQPSSAES
jgi:hypothetical protein